MARVRGITRLKTWAEVDEFGLWCENSEYKALQGTLCSSCTCCLLFLTSNRLINIGMYLTDWWADKKPHRWFFASINANLSRIELDDWHLTPSDTNLNESAHPYTNQHTGTGLTLVEAILKYVATAFIAIHLRTDLTARGW